MNRFIRHIILSILFLMAGAASLSAQTPKYYVRFVSSENGAFSNDGSDWAQAKNNLQTAIDELKTEIATDPGSQGLVFVQGDTGEGMKYVPTRRSTEDADGSMFNTSFCIYAGIHVYGGFSGLETYDPDHPELYPKLRLMDNEAILGDAEPKTYGQMESEINSNTNPGQTVRRWNFKYKTVLTGNHSTTHYTFIFDYNRGIYTTSFPLNSYHVVWFGTNGKITPDPDGPEKTLTGHYAGLVSPATLDGCTIEGGYASSSNLNGHDHTGYGGGVYMVKNALLRNCIVHHCAAMQRGGGVYMDGGGDVERCYIHTCQATGYGMQHGYGGGVCIDYDGSLQHSYVIQCAARIGAGLAICHEPDEYPEETAYPVAADRADPYTPFSMSTLISNCTSNAEGAGVYLDDGGTLNRVSVVNNKCIGPDVIYYGRRHGRTGGIYVNNGGTIHNTVAWGNECAANNDVQFAAFKDGSRTISVSHSAFSKGDITDWAAVTKDAVINLNDQNYPSPEYHTGYFPMFKQPTINAGVQYETGGVVNPTANADGEAYQRVYNWHPLSMSDLRGKGIRVTDATSLAEAIVHAATDVDVVGRQFESVSTCGALTNSNRAIQHVLMPSLEKTEGRMPSESDIIPTLFVDPTLVTAGGINDSEHTGFLDDQPLGADWTHPMQNLSDAIAYFKQYLKDPKKTKEEYAGNTYYEISGVQYPHVQIFVKEGHISVAGQSSYVSGHARTASIRPGSNMRLYGGFPGVLTGTTTAGRSPFDYNSDVSANILKGGFEKNSVHVFAIANQHDVVIDGFRLYGGNANISSAPTDPKALEEWNMYNSLADGAGIVVNNAMSTDAGRKDMTDNILRNCVFSNCAAPKGAAIYVSGGYKHGTEDRPCRAELTVVNSIIRNCTAGDIFGNPNKFVAGHPEGGRFTAEGIITANGNGHIWIRNCDVVNNCGFPFRTDTATVLSTDYFGKIEAYNSVVFSNGLQMRSDRSGISSAVFCTMQSYPNISGAHNIIDYDAVIDNNDLKAGNKRILTRNKNDDFTEQYNKTLSPVTGRGVDDTSSPKVTVRYPAFVNPSRNVGHSEGDDQSYYGGRINYEPLPTNPIVNAANTSISTGTGLLPEAEKDKTIGYDFSLQGRDYGGDPDIGAIETHRLPVGGAVIYVTPDGAGKRDGSSWANAIQGNAIYALNGSAAAGSDELDTTNGTTRIINTTNDGSATTGEANGVLTTDNRYCGGFGRAWFTSSLVNTTTNSTYYDYITEKNVYVGGVDDGTETVLRTDEYAVSNETVSTSAPPVGFVPGYHDDVRYPYGEISGASRSFWRANPYHSGTDWNNAADYDMDAFITACNTNGWINNSRQENYVGGLQYAVEKAATYNALAPGDPGRIDGIDSVQVWVSNGKYTDYKGFVMRNNTTVMGSFPAKEGGTPSLTERQALMSAVIDIPKSQQAEGLDAERYETILQLSDTDPKLDNETLNTAAVKYWDDDLEMVQTTTTDRETTSDRVITHTYTWDSSVSEVEKTSDYYLYSDFKDVSITSETTDDQGTAATSDDVHTLTFGTATSDKDCWHLTYTGDASTSGNNGVIGRYESNQMSGTTGVPVYQGNSTNLGSTTEQRLWLRNGSLTNVSLWQEMKNVPAGDYKIVVDMNAYYRNGTTVNNANVPTGVTFTVTDSEGTDVKIQEINAKDKKGSGKHLGRIELYRYVIPFTQASDGSLRVSIDVGAFDSTKGNNREVQMANFKLYWIRPAGYYESATTDVRTKKPEVDDVVNVTPSVSTTVSNHRTTLRKRVLTMPDICVPTYGGGGVGDPAITNRGKFSDDLSHTHRVFGGTKAKRTSWENDSFVEEDPNYVEYSDVFWDGFTIRHGFIADEGMGHGGGAGVNMYEGAHLMNCIVINNISHCERVKGGGIFCDGATSTIEGCFVLNNTSTHGTLGSAKDQNQIFAGGMFMYEGTCFNSLFAKNYSYGSAGGLGFCVGRFYNNTIAYNTCSLIENGHISGGAISLATSSSPNLFVANTIIYGNNGIAIRDRNTGYGNVNPFLHCYVQSEVAQPNDATNRNVTNWPTKISGKSCYGIGNIYLNGVAPSADNTPFEADIEGGVYNSSNPGAKANNDFRLLSTNPYCINKGSEAFAGTFYDALRNKGKTDGEITSSIVYQNVEQTELPNNDVAFADRVQDCQVDIGAYEFDGTRDIRPTLYPNETPKKAVFYVTENGDGMATAENAPNAACFLKFQKVLDAAGRWRYASYFYNNSDSITANQNKNNYTETELRKELQSAGVAANTDAAAITAELDNLKDYEVIVRLEGGPGSIYIPTRSTNLNTDNVNEMEKSLIVPHGIRIEGGYEGSFTEERDILGRPSRFSGEIVNETLGTRGNVFHVVTFTNDIFDVNEKRISNGGQLQFLGNTESDAAYMSGHGYIHTFTATEAEAHRTVLDGLFIQDGEANGSSTNHQIGAGAVVTSYAHIRNCVVQNNSASKYGGGLYLEPLALVSGCIVKGNSALQGGGIYVYEPVDDHGISLTTSSATFAHIISTTVVDNTATQNAGGLWFQTNVRANSSAFWRNTASDFGNVAGTFATGLTQVVENYPMNYCGVGSRRVAGVNNIELPSVANEGVRWDATMPYEDNTSKGENYFPITVSSVLGRAGMTYSAYEDFMALYPTLESTDIFGLNRMAQADDATMTLGNGDSYTKSKKDNSFIEIGARALNGSFEVKLEYTHVMTRLFVTTTERLPTTKAMDLQLNTVEKEKTARGIDDAAWDAMSASEKAALEDDVEMYKQMGSSYLNPFHRLGDALEYIIKVRKETAALYDAVESIADHYKDVRFEIFVCGGTFYPFRDAHGNQGDARANTFLVPEKVTIVGGVNPQEDGHAYCQETSGTKTVAGYDMNPATTYEIRSARTRMDSNGNHVKEPWEMTEQTILSGNAVTNDVKTNVYHVITCLPDNSQVGELPTLFSDAALGTPILDPWDINPNPSQGELLGKLERESQESLNNRTIFLDGLTITGGYANEIEAKDESDNFQKLTYFRGGGILVDGNWNSSEANDIDLPEVLGVAKRNIPLIMTACLVKDNTAANGGGVYTNGTFSAFSCHFTKNLSIGPVTERDQKYIPWSAGGAIAANYESHLWNSLFDNNEAKRGNYAIKHGEEVMRIEDETTVMNPIVNADLRHGYGGTISCSETGLARICNCDFVRNKAVAFPALYNFLDNNLRAQSSTLAAAANAPGLTEEQRDEIKNDSHYYGAGWHFAVNTIFWGNRATANNIASATSLEDEYYAPAILAADQRQPNHVANFGPQLDVATLTFCSYEKATGREGTVWYSNHDRAKEAPIKEKGGVDGLARLYAGDFVDVLDEYFGYYYPGETNQPFYKLDGLNQVPCAMTDPEILLNGATPTDEQKAAAVPYNYNLVLETENQAVGGPYFVQPSLSAGVDGYMETADWLVSRLNNSIDTGWGFLKQDVTMSDESSGLFNTTLLKADGTPAVKTPDDPDFLHEQYDDLFGEGFYNIHSKAIHYRFEDIGYPNLLPIGDDDYMEYSRDGEGEATNMRRISTHPKMGVQDVFIDMGIYEYQYVQLVTQGDEIDVIWVSPTENSGVTCNGSTAYQATSDLQGAIETLLLSRNDHDKMIKLKTGTYSPSKMTQGNHKAFFVNVPDKQDGVLLPKVLSGDDTHVARSITFRGGYPDDPANDPMKDYEEQRDIVANPVTFRMVKEIGNEDYQLEHLFIIEDAELKGTYANYMQGKNADFLEKVMPIVFDGITFINPYGNNETDGGAALFYGEQYQTKQTGGDFTKDHEHLLLPQSYSDGVTLHNIPKLIVQECSFINNGQSANVSAVRIKKGGGHSLFVNSLFHSNSGAPIDAVNTIAVNCTFARNGGHLTLKDEQEVYYSTVEKPVAPQDFPSGLYNSIIWQDGEAEASATKVQWDDTDLSLTSGNMQYNAYTFWNTGTGTFDEPTGTTAENAQHNILLSTDNEDIILGPNFIDPDNANPEERDFHLNPNAHLINKASDAIYKNFVPYFSEIRTQRRTETAGEGATTYYFHSVQHGEPAQLNDNQLQGNDPTAFSSTTTSTTDSEGTTITTVTSNDAPYTEYELANVARWGGSHIDRGAYECTANIQRVLYVTSDGSENKDGSSWENAFNIEQFQRAVDVASIYYLTTEATETDDRRAYVFVGSNARLNDVLKLRDGVSVYGGVIDNIHDVEKTEGKFTNASINSYITEMKAQRLGVATEGLSRNAIQGLVSPNTTVHESGFLLDGFWIQGATVPIDMTKDKTILINDVITGNTIADSGQPVVNLSGGSSEGSLLYNTLIYGNTAGSGAPTVDVGTYGYALNNTIVTANSGETALRVLGGLASDNASYIAHAQNNIDVNEYSSYGTMFAPYLRNSGANAYSPAAHLTSWEPYYYQLHEFANSYINRGTDDNGSGGGSTVKDGGNIIAKMFADYVDFSYDRDVLGNPRRLRDRVDKGCFETWRIEEETAVTATNETNAAFTTNYGGHQYPHAGSVVYVMKDANLIFATDGVSPRFTSAISPGYVLLKQGASIYGQGNPLNFGYVAAEKPIGTQYSLMALPFDLNVESTVEVANSAGVLTQTNRRADFTPYTYDGAARAAYNYGFRANNSALWLTDLSSIQNDASQINRTEGWLLDFGGNTPADTLRFTGWGAASNTFVYTEDATATKTVTLAQHDWHDITGSGYPQFTKAEDMGWNLKGQPWLVSTFRTDGTNPDFKMNVPHVLYSTMTKTLATLSTDTERRYGQFYTQRSWDSGAEVALGDGFFTQTAVIADAQGDGSETLTFKRPIYGGAAPVAPVKELITVELFDEDGLGDAVHLRADGGADTSMPYTINTDGIKWAAFNADATQLWVENEGGTPFSLAAHAPTEQRIAVGLSATREGRHTFALPDTTGTSALNAVWLIDEQRGQVVDLLREDYSVSGSFSTDDVSGRFFLQLGGVQPTINNPAQSSNYRVYVRDRVVHVLNTRVGDRIRIYTPAGALVLLDEAVDDHWRTQLQQEGVYLVNIENETHKVLVK